VARSACSPRSELEEARLDVACWSGSESQEGRRLPAVAARRDCREFAAPPDVDGLRGLARRVVVHGLPVRGVIESMTGARFVHDQLRSSAGMC
jgi:hypothetical protein